MEQSAKKKILIICTGNTCRSPMAEYIARNLAEQRGLSDQFEIHSAGLQAEPETSAAENAILALEEIGIDLTKHVPTPISAYRPTEFDEIYVMTYPQKRAVLNLGQNVRNYQNKVTVINMPDPYGKDLDTYRQCRDALAQYFGNVIK